MPFPRGLLRVGRAGAGDFVAVSMSMRRVGGKTRTPVGRRARVNLDPAGCSAIDHESPDDYRRWIVIRRRRQEQRARYMHVCGLNCMPPRLYIGHMKRSLIIRSSASIQVEIDVLRVY